MAKESKDKAREVKDLREDKTEREKALDDAIAAIHRAYGKGSIMKLGESMTDHMIEVLPTGSLSLDVALGVGGIPRGRIIEIYGPESSGKTTVALHMIAEAQSAAELPDLSTRSMRWIRNMPEDWVWISIICIFPSRITVSRHWRLRRPWCVPARWISSLWTR